MPPPLLFDLDQADLSRVVLTREQIYQQLLPHRFEFMLLGGVCLLDRAGGRSVLYADIRPDDWWVRGHIPDRPLLPGVIMLEMAAQAAAVSAKVLHDFPGFIGLSGISNCKFRDAVVPPARLYILNLEAEHRSRRIITNAQGVMEGRMIFEAKITGLAMP